MNAEEGGRGEERKKKGGGGGGTTKSTTPPWKPNKIFSMLKKITSKMIDFIRYDADGNGLTWNE